MENQIEIYQGINWETQIEERFENETTWLTYNRLVKLFKSSKANIREQTKNIFESKKLEKGTTVRDFRTVQMEGKRAVEKDKVHYYLDVIIAVGYRVNSKRGSSILRFDSIEPYSNYLKKMRTIKNMRHYCYFSKYSYSLYYLKS